MGSSSNDRFCSLDMLAEVASATLQNDPSLVPSIPQQKTKNNRIGSSSRKSVNCSEKLTLEQIKRLSEKNLIEMFSEHICDEMKKNYSFQCFLIPDECSQVFKSFGNETRARYKMKSHLLSHIRDLSTTENASKNQGVFMSEPLHARRKRLKEISRKNTRKKKKSKQLPNKIKKDLEHLERGLEHFNKGVKDYISMGSKVQHRGSETMKSDLNFTTENNGSFCTESKTFMGENTSDVCATNISSELNYLSYFSYGPKCDLGAEQVISQSQSKPNEINSAFSKKPVKRKQRSKHQSDSKKRTPSALKSDLTQKSNPNYTRSNSLLNCDVQSESERCLPVHHDHTYTSVNGKTLSSHLTSVGEGSKSKLYKDHFTPKKTQHRCLKRESPLLIPTPPFPYVYVPLLPHIALIQEVGFNFKTRGCKCKDNDFTEGLFERNNTKHVPPSLPKQTEIFVKSLCESPSEVDVNDAEGNENSPSDANVEGILFEDGSNSEASEAKLQDSSFCIDDLLIDECPENLKSIEKKLAVKYIRALRTKKKDERGPLTCQICKNKSFTAQATLMYHYRSHAGIKPFTCSVCEATFTRQHSLNYHMLIHNNKSRFVCTDCGRNFRHPSHYKEHLRRHTGETPYECTDCDLR